MNDLNLIRQFMGAMAKRDFSTMDQLYTADVQFFDPLFGYIDGNVVLKMWKFRYESCAEFELIIGQCNDEGDGYFTCSYQVKWRLKNEGKLICQKIKAYFRIQDGKISEHSDGYSVHDWCAQQFGWLGKWLGWNRFYQQSIKNKIRKQFLQTEG